MLEEEKILLSSKIEFLEEKNQSISKKLVEAQRKVLTLERHQEKEKLGTQKVRKFKEDYQMFKDNLSNTQKDLISSSSSLKGKSK